MICLDTRNSKNCFALNANCITFVASNINRKIMNFIKNRQQRLFVFLLVVGIISLVLFLGDSLFNTKGEPREAVVALSMLQSGDWISPINNGVDLAYKPPFFHWCVALCSLLTGKVTEFSARFPSALATIIMVLAAYWYMLKNKVDCRLAFLTGIVTLTAFEVHRASMACRVDMVLSALTVLSLYSFHRWYVGRNRWHIPLTVLLISGAFLSKGPVGALLPCMVMGVYMLVRGENFFKAFFMCLGFVAMSSVLPLCWYYLAYLERGDTFFYLVYEENVLRFLGKMVYSSHEEPAIYNVLTMLAGYLPHTLLLVFSLFAIKYRKPDFSGGLLNWTKTLWTRVRNMSDQDLLSLLSAVLIFVFYCIPKSKRSVYLLPVYPFAAYFLAKYMLWIASNHRTVMKVYGWVLAVITLLMPFLLIVIKFGVVPHSIFHGKHADENLAFLVSFESAPISLMTVVLIIVAIVSVWLFCRCCKAEDGYRMTLSVSGLILTAYLMLDGIILPRVNDVKSDYYVAQEIYSIVPADAKIWDYRHDWKPGERNRIHQFTVNFYVGDRIVPLDLNKPESGYLIMGDDDFADFILAYPDYSLTKVKRFSHRSCDDKRCLTLYSFVTDKER